MIKISTLYTANTLLLLIFSITTMHSAHAEAPRSGYEFLTKSTQTMQDDEFSNPGMAAVERGRRLFNAPGVNNQSCATCHGENGEKLDIKKIATYPVYNEEYKVPFTLQNQLNMCWEEHLDNVPYVYDCTELIALEAFVKNKARGERMNVDISGPLKPFYEAGKELYNTRFGQVDLSCKHCHEYYAGQKLRGQTLSQGQTNGFPEYRLGSGRITSLHGRLTECFISFRATPFDKGSEEFINLEVYLNARGNGLKIETPAVRY